MVILLFSARQLSPVRLSVRLSICHMGGSVKSRAIRPLNSTIAPPTLVSITSHFTPQIGSPNRHNIAGCPVCNKLSHYRLRYAHKVPGKRDREPARSPHELNVVYTSMIKCCLELLETNRKTLFDSRCSSSCSKRVFIWRDQNRSHCVPGSHLNKWVFISRRNATSSMSG